MLTRLGQQGFSIIELATALTIIGVLMALGMPSLSEYIQNARLGTAAQSFYSGLNLARTEAIRLNGPVEFVVTGDAIASGIENSLVPGTTGTNWVVRYRASASAPYDLVEAKSAFEGGGISPSVTIAASDAVITFGSLGGTASGVATGIAIQNPMMGLCAPAGPVRCWQVLVAPGGQVHLCDPAAAVGDSRAC